LADISYCSNTECPLADSCFRADLSTAPEYHISMAHFEPDKETGKCDYYSNKELSARV